MKILILFVFAFLLISNQSCAAPYKVKKEDVVVSDFESALNNFNGSVNTFGASEGSGYCYDEAHSGRRSYKLVVSRDTLAKQKAESDFLITGLTMQKTNQPKPTRKKATVTWATFIMGMGPVRDKMEVLPTVIPKDVSGFKYLIFWVKGRRGGEHFKVHMRDIYATTYAPQVIINPKVRVAKEWRQVKINLARLKKKIDLTKITQIGIGFGSEAGGRTGNVIYVDDFILVK